MDSFSEKTSNHISRLMYVIRNAANYRSLVKYKDDFDQSYWFQIFNNFFDVAILEWCKVFGTDSEPTHWKTIVNDHASFRKGLLNCIGLDESRWSKFWQEVKDYRNNNIAHFKKTPGLQYPSLDVIINSTFYYYNWLLKEMDKRGIIQEPEDLEDYYHGCLIQAEVFSEKAYNSTKNLKEKVF